MRYRPWAIARTWALRPGTALLVCGSPAIRLPALHGDARPAVRRPSEYYRYRVVRQGKSDSRARQIHCVPKSIYPFTTIGSALRGHHMHPASFGVYSGKSLYGCWLAPHSHFILDVPVHGRPCCLITNPVLLKTIREAALLFRHIGPEMQLAPPRKYTLLPFSEQVGGVSRSSI